MPPLLDFIELAGYDKRCDFNSGKDIYTDTKIIPDLKNT